jgi:hypothetical protein
MHFHQEMRYDAAPADVHAMLADPAFRDRVCEAANTISHEVEILAEGEGMRVRIDQRQPADGIPGFAQKIVGHEIHVVQREEWSDATTARLDVEIPGKPGHMRGTITLAQDGEGTVETVEADVKVAIPMLGGKLEKLIADLLGSALRSEQRVGEAWLRGER